MKIKKILSQHRRDFRATYVCEHCNVEVPGYGYDDTHFHVTVIPEMECETCGKKSPYTYVPRPTKYDDREII